MPALYAHLRFGEEVASTLPVPFSTAIEKYPEAFCLGTQGPDILFYHQPMKKNDIRTRGTYLHTFSGNAFFSAQAKKFLIAEGNSISEKAENNGAYTAYLCGFLCHFVLDTICHPYIDEHSTEAVSHGKIESEFDKYILKRDGMPIRGYNTATPILDRNGTKDAVSTALDVPTENIALAIKTMRKINGWFSKKCELFHTIAHIFLKIAGMERKFGDMFIHKKDDPLCAEINEVLFDKWQNAIPQATAAIQDFFNALESLADGDALENELFRYNFSGIKNTEE